MSFLSSPSTGFLIGFKTTADLVAKSSMFLLLVIAARLLSPHDFGLISLGFLTGWLLTVAGDFGLQIFLTREVARDPRQAELLYWTLLRWRLVTFTVGLALLLAATSFFKPVAQITELLLVTAAQAVFGLADFVIHLLRGIERTDIESAATLLFRPFYVACSLGVLGLSGQLRSFVLSLFVLSCLYTLSLHFLTLRVLVQASKGEVKPDLPPPQLRSVANELLPIGAGILFSGLYFRSDLYLIQAWLGVSEVGYYNAVFRLIDALRLLPAAMLAVVFPHLVRASTFSCLVRYGAWLILGGFVAAGLSYCLANPLISWTFGEDYLPAVPAFRILLWAVPLLYLNFLMTHQLIAWGAQLRYAFLTGAGLLLNLSLNFWLIPGWGIAGAAWSTLATEIYLSGGCLISLYPMLTRLEEPNAST